MGKRRYRKVFTDMQADEKYLRLTPPQPCGRALWWEMLTGEQTNIIAGLAKISEVAFADNLGWSLEGFRSAFAELVKEGMAKADWNARVVWAPSIFMDNPPDNPKVVIGWANAWNQIQDCELKAEVYQFIRLHIEERDRLIDEKAKEDGDDREGKMTLLEALEKSCGNGSRYGIGNGIGNRIDNGIGEGIANGMAYQEQQAGAGSRNSKQEQQQQSDSRAAGKKTVSTVVAQMPPKEIKEVVAGLRTLGMAKRDEALCYANPQLAKTALEHCTTRFKNPKAKRVESKPGYINACLKNPLKFGFQLVDGEWVDAAAESKGRKGTEAMKKAKDAQVKVEKEMALEEQRLHRWDARPESVKKYVRQLVRESGKLFAQDDDEAFGFKSACMNLAEELERKGKL